MPLHARGHEVTIEPQPTDSQYLGACSRNRNRTASVFMHGIMQPLGIWRWKHADEAEPLGSILSLLINLLTVPSCYQMHWTWGQPIAVVAASSLTLREPVFAAILSLLRICDETVSVRHLKWIRLSLPQRIKPRMSAMRLKEKYLLFGRVFTSYADKHPWNC